MVATKRGGRKANVRTRRQDATDEGETGAVRSDLPYSLSNSRIPELFSRLQSAAVPARVSVEFLRKLGFTSSNDRAFPSLLRRLGFLDASGAPTERYRMYRNPAESRAMLGEGVYEAYGELFAVNERVHRLDAPQVRGIVSQVTGHGDENARRIASTFLALAELADVPEPGVVTVPAGPISAAASDESAEPAASVAAPVLAPKALPLTGQLSFRHNIEIHLPATTEISVYNAIFKSLREHLLG